MTEVTKLQSANIAKSLRATIPMSIVKQLNLNEGDYLEWDMDKVNGRWIVVVKKGVKVKL